MTAGAEVRGFRDEWRQNGSTGTGCWGSGSGSGLGARGSGLGARRLGARGSGLGARGSGLGARNEAAPTHSSRTSKNGGSFHPRRSNYPSPESRAPAFAQRRYGGQAGYLRLVTWSQTAAPPPPMAAPMSAPFLPPMAAPTPAPAPAEDPMMMALFATERVFGTGRSS